MGFNLMTFLQSPRQVFVVRCAIISVIASIFTLHSHAEVIKLTASCDVELGAINAVCVRSSEGSVAVYGWDQAVKHVLLTHGRRDVVWRARKAAESAKVVAPARERDLLENGLDYWGRFPQARYHDYAQQTTKVPSHSWTVNQWVEGGDAIHLSGTRFEVIETPGFTRGAVSYVAVLDGKRVGFIGDLIYGDGKLLDLYSYQDAIPVAQIRGYHGYGARLADLVASLNRIIDAKLDVAVPARGPIIPNPTDAATKLRQRVQAIYHNYLSTNALNWYFKEDRMRACGRRVLGQDADIELMPYCEYDTTPDWIYENSTSRLILSETGAGFLLDCGSDRVIEAIEELIQQQAVDKVEGIFVTHFHDDHTDAVAKAVKVFQSPVYATEEYSDLLEQPAAFHLPAMTENPIANIKVMKDGATMKWHEYTFTFHFFPGQAFYHGAMLVEKDGEKPVFFIGDAFAPSGFDDYCILNRNLLHDHEGYLLCLEKIRDAGDCWLINEHIRHVFKFNATELDHLTNRYRERRNLIRETVAWDDANYAVDEQWAVFYPRSETLSSKEVKTIELRITNHSAKARDYSLKFNLPENVVSLDKVFQKLTVQAGSMGTASIRLKARGRWKDHPWRIITADIETDGIHVREWSDAYLTLKEVTR